VWAGSGDSQPCCRAWNQKVAVLICSPPELATWRMSQPQLAEGLWASIRAIASSRSWPACSQAWINP